MMMAAGVLLIGAAVVGMILVSSQVVGGATTAQAAVGAMGSGNLSANAKGKLNQAQQAFASELSKQSGLDPGVVAAWVMLEEGGQSSAPNGPNNWLNIGATDSGFFGASNPAWQDPVKAADFTAQWLRGTAAPGFGTASSGIQNILKTVGQSVQAQISAIQNSGWASSGYPDFQQVFQEVS